MPLAGSRQRACGSVVVLSLAVLGRYRSWLGGTRDALVERVSDRLVCLGRRVLVDRRKLADEKRSNSTRWGLAQALPIWRVEPASTQGRERLHPGQVDIPCVLKVQPETVRRWLTVRNFLACHGTV